jgi:MFS family permease
MSVQSLFSVGLSAAWGILSDRIGRSKAIIFSIGSFGLFTVLTGLTNSWMLVMLWRFLSGFGVGGVLVVTPTLLSEVWPARSRAIFIGILSIGFPVGIFSAGLIDLFVSNWHQAFMIGVFPLALSLLAAWTIQESEKWKSAARSPSERIIPVFDKANRLDLVVGSITFGTMLVGLWAIFSWLPTWIQTLITVSDGQRERGLSMMFLGAGGLTGGFFSGWLSNAMGLRRAMMVCFAGCSVFSFLLFKTNAAFSNIVFAEIAMLAVFFGASQGILSAYIPELFPAGIRATATGFCFNLGRFVTGSVVFFVGALVIVLGGHGNALFLFSMVFVAGWMTTFFSKEVKSK